MIATRKNRFGPRAERTFSTGHRRAARVLQFGAGWLVLALCALLVPRVAFARQDRSSNGDASATKIFRVCVDPGDMPFSDQAKQGFEDKLATMAAAALGDHLEFEWQRGDGLKHALYVRQCDAIMGWPTQDKTVLTTRPYYRSTYVLIYRQASPYRIHSLDDPVLKQLSIGIRTIGDEWTGLPGGAMLAAHNLQDSARPYPLRGNSSTVSPSLDLIKAVVDGDVDAAIAWGPPAGYFAPRQSVKLAVVPLTNAHLRVPSRFSISMAVRPGNAALRKKLDEFLDQHRKAIHALLAGYGVPLLPLEDANSNPSVAEQ